jgi:hypothetical protein
MKLIMHYDELGNLINIERAAAEVEELVGEFNKIRMATDAGEVRLSASSSAEVQEVISQAVAERGAATGRIDNRPRPTHGRTFFILDRRIVEMP